jgi:hypothetical protein
MSQSENERPAKTRPDAKAAPHDRELSDAELETVAAAGDPGGTGDGQLPNKRA